LADYRVRFLRKLGEEKKGAAPSHPYRALTSAITVFDPLTATLEEDLPTKPQRHQCRESRTAPRRRAKQPLPRPWYQRAIQEISKSTWKFTSMNASLPPVGHLSYMQWMDAACSPCLQKTSYAFEGVNGLPSSNHGRFDNDFVAIDNQEEGHPGKDVCNFYYDNNLLGINQGDALPQARYSADFHQKRRVLYASVPLFDWPTRSTERLLCRRPFAMSCVNRRSPQHDDFEKKTCHSRPCFFLLAPTHGNKIDSK
uniref:DUF1996 domain-containing protein n=1 Tax=Haemonchus placei TaxID=6290 RepID=A0A0N4WBZ1_HAEPC